MSRKLVSLPALVIACVLVPCVTGCGDGEFPVRPAKGKVVCNGTPVTVGSVTFSPIGEGDVLAVGKSATATLGPDGTFVLTTNKEFDGAVVGKHRVQYNAPEGDEDEGTEDSADAPEVMAGDRARNLQMIRERAKQRWMEFMQDGEIVVEVTEDGDNDFTIEVVRRGNRED